MYSEKYTMNSVHYTIFSVQYTMYTAQYTVYSPVPSSPGPPLTPTDLRKMSLLSSLRYNTVQRTLYIVNCTLYSVHCTLGTVHFALYIVNCTVYIDHSTLVPVQGTLDIGYVHSFPFQVHLPPPSMTVPLGQDFSLLPVSPSR